MNLDALKAQFEQLSTEHAALWRGLTMTDQWRRLQSLEGQLDLLAGMIQQLEPAPEPAPAPTAA